MRQEGGREGEKESEMYIVSGEHTSNESSQLSAAAGRSMPLQVVMSPHHACHTQDLPQSSDASRYAILCCLKLIRVLAQTI